MILKIDLMMAPTPSSAEVKERIKLYTCFPFRPSWPVLEWTLPLYRTGIASLFSSFVRFDLCLQALRNHFKHFMVSTNSVHVTKTCVDPHIVGELEYWWSVPACYQVNCLDAGWCMRTDRSCPFNIMDCFLFTVIVVIPRIQLEHC
jgi:hypothetical protein